MLKLNLRLKLAIGFIIFLFISTWVNLMFLHEFDMFDKDSSMLIHASNMSNLCLEVRRYEKNFIMKQNNEDLDTTFQYLQDLTVYFSNIASEADQQYNRSLLVLEQAVAAYGQLLISLKEQCPPDAGLMNCWMLQPLEQQGAQMVNISEEMVKNSQEVIQAFVKDTKIKLAYYYTFLILFSLTGIVVYYMTVATRLKSLEKAANSVAKGNFSELPISHTSDEVQQVYKAFERMVSELEERQEMLFQAEKMSSIGTLASGVAHQLNNPLNNIATSCQLAINEAETLNGNDFLSKLLRTIEEETSRSAEIVRGLLEFSRKENFICKPTSINAITSQAIRLVANELPEGILIKQDVPANLSACVDEQKMKEVFVNILINGIQAIPSPPGVISIAAEVDLDTDQLIIIVADTGVGIEKVDRKKIFDPFYTTKELGRGTGLGLAVVYGIIDKHKGTISVRSNSDGGTTFIVSLPPPGECEKETLQEQ